MAAPLPVAFLSFLPADDFLFGYFQSYQVDNGIGILQLKNEKWYIYKVILSSDISDRAFEYLAFYLREYLQLYLLEKEPKYIPIWPPLVKQEDEYLVDRTNTKVYGCVMSGNDEPKTYIYNGVLSVPREIKYNDKLLPTLSKKVETLFTSNRLSL